MTKFNTPTDPLCPIKKRIVLLSDVNRRPYCNRSGCKGYTSVNRPVSKAGGARRNARELLRTRQRPLAESAVVAKRFA